MEYNTDDYVSLDMKHCYPASFKGVGDCKEYYDSYGHPDGQFFHVALDGSYDLPVNGFVKLTTWKLKEGLHPIIYGWYGKQGWQTGISEKGWLPVPLLKFFTDRDLLSYTAHEAILYHSQKTQWLPTDNHAARIVIGKFTQGARNGEQHLQRRIVLDKEELNFLIKRAHKQGTMVRTEEIQLMDEDGALPPYWVICYYHDAKAQYYHVDYDLVICYDHGDIAARCCPKDTIRALVQRKKTIDQDFAAFDELEGPPWEDRPYWTALCEDCGCVREEQHIWVCLAVKEGPPISFATLVARIKNWREEYRAKKE